MKITPEGKQNLEREIRKLQEELKALREEKARAYNLTGDTWHDNPYFNSLEQQERTIGTKIAEIQGVLKEGELVNQTRNMDTVGIGSIVRCLSVYEGEEEIEILELVGHGETDIAHGKIGYESPLGRNLMGLHQDDIVTFDVPGGKTTYRILRFYASWEDARQDREV